MVDYIIKLPQDNPERMDFLKSKLVEAANDVESARLEISEYFGKHFPKKYLNEMVREQTPEYARLDILANVLYERKFNSFNMVHEVMPEIRDEFKWKAAINYNDQFHFVKHLVEKGKEPEELNVA